jgi:molybdenum cofactor cytidylyltransferase
VSGVAAIILAAGTSSRFGAANKLLAEWRGQAMLRTVAEVALATELEPVIVVTGHEAEDVRAALAGLEVAFVHNPNHPQGQATSLQAGIRAVPPACEGAMILLGDMPRVSASDINQLLDVFAGPASIIVPVHEGQRGNPVIIGRQHFSSLLELEGDEGARSLLSGDRVTRVEMETDAVLQDFDTPEAMT